MFYTPSTLTVSEGQKVNGYLTCAPNARNNRDLDITIKYEVEPDLGSAINKEQKATVHYKMCVSDVPEK